MDNIYSNLNTTKLFGEVVIYGGGHRCVEFFIKLMRSQELANLNIIALVDQDPQKVGTEVFGYEIKEVEMLRDFKDAPIIVTPIAGRLEIAKSLLAYGFDKIYFYGAEEVWVLDEVKRYLTYVNEKVRYDQLLSENASAISQVMQLLCDDWSRFIMQSFIDTVFGNPFGSTKKYCITPNQYFSEDIISLGSEEVFVDCGSYDGGTTERFVKRCPNYRYIYCFEPDPLQYELTKAYFKARKLQRIELFKNGVWSSDGEIGFNSIGGGGSSIVDVSGEGNISVETISLDNLIFIKDKRPTFIKMDIEGAELEALKGASRIIERDHPKLAICLYHQPQDIWEIPLWIASNFPTYRLFIRQHAIATETVLYCI